MKIKSWLGLGLSLACLVTVGCTTGRVAAINAAAAPIAADLNSSVQDAVNNAKTGYAAKAGAAVGMHVAVASQPDVDGRLKAYEKLQTEKNDLDAKFSVAFDSKQHGAETIGRWKTGIGISGIAAGIGAAALVAASPANAVWVTICSGYAGGVAGMNSVFDNNGYSREQIAALETTVAQQYAKVSADIRLVTLFILASDPTTTSDNWLKELEKQEAAMTQLQALAMTLNIPTGPIQPPPKQ